MPHLYPNPADRAEEQSESGGENVTFCSFFLFGRFLVGDSGGMLARVYYVVFCECYKSSQNVTLSRSICLFKGLDEKVFLPLGDFRVYRFVKELLERTMV